MAITTKTFTTIVSDAVVAIQGASTALLDLTVGSVLRAFVEAQAAVVLWLQGLALQIAALTRFSTSSGADADTWAADYGFVRLGAHAASGSVTFARFTATAGATVPVGFIVQTADGSQKYQVVADTGKPAYSSSAGGYLLGIGVSSISATVQSVSSTQAGNVTAGLINTMGGAIAGVDTVTNPAGFTNGADAESDAAFRARFLIYLASLAKGTPAAIGNAIQAVQQGATYTLTENYDYSGAVRLGYFYAVVDDGSGAPPSGFLTAVAAAIEAVRPVGATFGVFAPVLVSANVALTITTAGGYVHGDIVTAVTAALQAYINSLSIGATLPYTKLSQVAYATSPAVTNVTGVFLNSGTADLVATPKQLIRAGTMTIT